MSIYKRKIEILDADRQRFSITCEVTDRNGYPEFTASGEWGSSMGQCLDHIKPASEAQRKLVKIWEEWHMNGMNAGTPEQQEIVNDPEQYRAILEGDRIYQHVHGMYFVERRAALLQNTINTWIEAGMPEDEANKEALDYYRQESTQKEILSEISVKAKTHALELKEKVSKSLEDGYKYDYDLAVLVLQMNNKHTVTHPEKEELFTYGKSWYTKQLPESFIDELEELLNELETEQEDGPKVTEENHALFEHFNEPQTVHALALMLELRTFEIQDIYEEGNDLYNVQGTLYLAGDEDTVNEHWNAYLENYIEECILPEMPEMARNYFDREKWKREARFDGRGHSLNHYDGSELYHGEYYAYRQ